MGSAERPRSSGRADGAVQLLVAAVAVAPRHAPDTAGEVSGCRARHRGAAPSPGCPACPPARDFGGGYRRGFRPRRGLRQGSATLACARLRFSSTPVFNGSF